MEGSLGETATGATGRHDLVVGISGEEVKKLDVEPLVDSLVDLVLAIATQEGATEGGDGCLGDLEALGLINKGVVRGAELGTEGVGGVQDHGSDALLMVERMHLSLVGFDCFLGILELATGLVMGALGGLELELGFLDRGLGLGGGCLERGAVTTGLLTLPFC